MIKDRFIQDLIPPGRSRLDVKAGEVFEDLQISEVASMVCGVIFLLRLETKDHQAEEVKALDLLLSRAETKAARLVSFDPQDARASNDIDHPHTAATDRSR